MSGESCQPSNCKRSAHSVWRDGEGIHTGKLALQTHRYGQGYPAATLTMNFGLTPARAGTTGREISGVLSRVTSPSGGPKVYGHCDLRLLHLDKKRERMDGAKLQGRGQYAQGRASLHSLSRYLEERPSRQWPQFHVLWSGEGWK